MNAFADLALEFAPPVFNDDAQTRELASFVRVPPKGSGQEEFRMGNGEAPEVLVEKYGRTEACYADTRPRHVTLATPIFMMRFPVTNVLFSGFVANGKEQRSRYITTAEQIGYARILDGNQWRNVPGACWQKLPYSKSDIEDWNQLPTTCVSWHDAVAFANWLNTHTNADNTIPRGFVFRLPTEAEWEFCCRAGTASPFWWGNELDDEHAIHRCGKFPNRCGPEPVELKGGRPGRGRWNAWGFCDMSGNVWEWCADIYTTARPERRILRGGSWGSSSAAGRMLTFFRGHMPPDDVNDRNGFRLVCGPPLNDGGVAGSTLSILGR